MAGRKRGTPGEKQEGSMQLYGKGASVDRIREAIVTFAAERGIADMRVAADRWLEHQAVQNRGAGYARGVDSVDVIPLDTWPEEAV